MGCLIAINYGEEVIHDYDSNKMIFSFGDKSTYPPPFDIDVKLSSTVLLIFFEEEHLDSKNYHIILSQNPRMEESQKDLCPRGFTID